MLLRVRVHACGRARMNELHITHCDNLIVHLPTQKMRQSIPHRFS